MTSATFYFFSKSIHIFYMVTFDVGLRIVILVKTNIFIPTYVVALSEFIFISLNVMIIIFFIIV